jgi:hypothetical protein
MHTVCRKPLRLHSVLRHGALVLSLGLCAPASHAAVTNVSLAPTVGVYHGDCPATIGFSGSVTVNGPGIVSYVFTRSDGAVDTVTKTLVFFGAGTKSISSSWTLGGPSLPHTKQWKAVKILAPNALESAHANFEVFCDPPLNSARAAHGNTDWHIDTANEFLFGKDMNGNTTAANHAPASWTKAHIHTGLTNTAHYYDDDANAAVGDDTHLTRGIDKPMLFFYAGHGSATSWSTLGDSGHQSDMLLGNIQSGGQLRYYWQCSCEVFAHGPLVCDGSSCDYSAPEDFDGSADSGAMRNVFERWGPAIGNDLRMACGVSTLAYCHEGNVNAIWDNFNNKGKSVADSFIDGLGSATVKPLCITRGGADISKTPLWDETFTNHRNTAASTHLHILYASGTDTEPPVVKWTLPRIPYKLLRVRLVPPGDPVEFERGLVRTPDGEQFRDAQIVGGWATVSRHAESGSVLLRAAEGSSGARALERGAVSSEDARRAALEFARRIGWAGADVGAVHVTRLLTASMPVDKSGAIARGEKNIEVSITRRLGQGDQAIDVVGGGGRIDVTLDGNGQVLAASRVWRDADVIPDELPVLPFEQAQAEAERRLEKKDVYTLADWRLVYKEESANVEQPELALVYEFDFVPADRSQQLDVPPRRVEIQAQTR